MADSGKIVFKGDGADVGLLGWVGNKGVLEWGNVPEEVPMDTVKVTSKINEVAGVSLVAGGRRNRRLHSL